MSSSIDCKYCNLSFNPGTRDLPKAHEKALRLRCHSCGYAAEYPTAHTGIQAMYSPNEVLMSVAAIVRLVTEHEQREKVVTEMESVVNRSLTVEERHLIELGLTIKYELDLDIDESNGESNDESAA